MPSIPMTCTLRAALLQPIASDDVVAALAEVAVAAPVNGMVEVAGPEKIPLDDLVGAFLRANDDSRQVVSDVHARCFGMELNDRSLTAADGARLGATRFQDWLDRAAPEHRAA